MKRLSPSTQSPRFKGVLRHYHRAGARRSSWDQWVDGGASRPRTPINWLKILGIAVALAALGGILAGLIIELSGS